MRDAYPRPFVFLGYVVTQPHAPRPAPYRILIEDGKMLDIEPLDSDRWSVVLFARACPLQIDSVECLSYFTGYINASGASTSCSVV